jgi:hypothetical protein
MFSNGVRVEYLSASGMSFQTLDIWGHFASSQNGKNTIFQSINEPEIGVRSCYRMVKNIKNYY